MRSCLLSTWEKIVAFTCATQAKSESAAHLVPGTLLCTRVLNVLMSEMVTWCAYIPTGRLSPKRCVLKLAKRTMQCVLIVHFLADLS